MIKTTHERIFRVQTSIVSSYGWVGQYASYLDGAD